MSKKILAIVLTAALMLSMAAIPAAAAETQFPDTEGHWAASAIDQWAEYGVVQGDNGKFRPNSEMTRGEYATAMVNLLGLTKKSNYNPFTDLKGDEWYADAILKAYAAGILKGDESKRCKAGATVSREQAFVMAGRALGVEPQENPDLSKFKDGEKVSNWAKPMMAALVESGFVNGTSATTLEPTDEINRASVMQVLSNTVTTYVTKPGTYTALGKGFVVVKAEKGEVTITGAANGIVVGQSSSGSTVNLLGMVVSGAVKVDASQITLNVEDSKVEGTVEVTPQASGAELNVAAGSTLENVTTSADGVAVKGEGEVKNVEVAGGDQVEVATPGTSVKVDESAKDSTVTAGGETVKPGESSTTAGTPDGFKPEEPDTPSGGGSVTPSGKTSAIGTAVTASTGLNWANAPADKTMKLDYSVNGTTITATGTLIKATGFTGFNSTKPEQQSGYYAFFKIPVSKADATLAQSAEGTIFSLNGKTWNKDGDSDGNKGFIVEGMNTDSPYIEMVLRVAGPDATKVDNITFTADWDGDAADYSKTTYTMDFSKVKLLATAPGNGTIARDPGTTGGASAVLDVTDSTATFTGTIAYYDADTTVGRNEPGNYVGVEITAPAGFTPSDALTSVAIGGNIYTWTNIKDTDTSFYWYPKVTAENRTFTATVTWAPGYTQEFKVVATGATLTPAPKASEITVAAPSADITYLGKKPSELGAVTITSGEGNTYSVSGSLEYVENFDGYATGAEGNFLMFDFVVPSDVNPADSGTVMTVSYDGRTGTYSYADLGTNSEKTLHFVLKVTAKSNFTATVDWDGEGKAYLPVTYTLDLNGLTLKEKGTTPLLGTSAEVSFVKETNPESPYALMNLTYDRKSALDSIQVEAKVNNKVVWREKYTNVQAKDNAVFTWSMRDLNPQNNLQEGANTPTGSAAESLERTNNGIIPAGTTINITITGTKSGQEPATITKAYEVKAADIQVVWFGGWPTEGKQTSKANIDAALAALGTASFAGNLENNGYFETQAGVTVTVTKPDANTTNFALNGSVTSGIPSSAPYNTDFIPAQFDPEVAKNGYTAVTLAGIVEENQELTQTNPAFALYPAINWVGITGTGDNLVKTKTYSSAGDLDFLLIPGKNVTISVNGKTYTVENNLTFTAESFGAYSFDDNNTTNNLTAVQTEKSAVVDGRKYVTVAVNGADIESGLPEKTANADIWNLFNGDNVTFQSGDKFAVVTLPDFIPAGESNVLQVNSLLSYYTTDEFVTSSNGVYTKSKPYNKQAADSYSFLLKEGESVRITLTQNGQSTEYTFVNHATFA